MSLLTPAEIERLAFIAGETDFERWKAQMEDADFKIERDIAGAFHEAFDRCLPIWVETGRIQDLSRGVRVPKYWGHYSKHLGDAFADRFREDHEEVLAQLKNFPADTREYLCICDLLTMLIEQCWMNDFQIPNVLFESNAPVPKVIRKEYQHDNRFDNSLDRIGSFLYRFHQVEHRE